MMSALQEIEKELPIKGAAMIKLVASDIDGTLLRDGNTEISKEVFEHIRRLKESGVLFAAASGRQYTSIRRLFAPVADDIVYLCENGAILYQDGQVLGKLPMDRAGAEKLIGQILAHEDMEVLISGADTSYMMPKSQDYLDHIRYFVGNNITLVESAEEISEDILKVSAYCRSGAAVYDKPFGDIWRGMFRVAVSGEKWLDITEADKGRGLTQMCRTLGISLSETAAFGDNFNDLAMLEKAGYPWIIRNSVLDRAGYGGKAGICVTDRVEAVLAKL